MTRIVRLPPGGAVSWDEIAVQLRAAGETPAVRMIDGLLAFPDELPPPDWTELRIGLSGGTTTLRREGDTVHCVCWGTGDPALVNSWNAVCWAVAEASSGRILEPDGKERSAGEFRRDVLTGPG